MDGIPKRSDKDQAPVLTIVIPAFNEAERLPETLERIAGFISKEGLAAEVIVVDSASTDGTKDIIEEFCSRRPFVRYLYESVSGKGAAVRTGMLAGQGEYLLFSDADLAVPIEEANRFFPLLRRDYDIAIGSREAEGAKRYAEPFHRHLMGRVFNLIVRLLLLPGFSDTQCGFKCFRIKAARELFSASEVNGWSFDAEVLYLARLKGYRIVEVPVSWHYGEKSKVRAVRDSWLMFKDVLAIRKKRRKGSGG